MIASRRKAHAVKIVLVYILLAIGIVTVLAPFWWMVSTSLKRQIDVFQIPMKWIPDPVMWSNYPEAFRMLPLARFIWNTGVITFFAIIGSTTASIIAAYAFSRLRWPGRDVLFVLVLATLMLPYQTTMIPHFILFRYLGWLDTYLPLLVPFFLSGNPFFIFLLRQYFMTLPLELDDAARIDGCSRLGVLWRIILPQSKPILATIVIFIVRNRWQDFLLPMIYLNDRNKFPIALGLRLFQISPQEVVWPHLMAATTVSMLPMLVLFYFGQRYFIQGIVFSGVKG